MLMSGGYEMSNAEVIGKSVNNLLTKFNLLDDYCTNKQVDASESKMK